MSLLTTSVLQTAMLLGADKFQSFKMSLQTKNNMKIFFATGSLAGLSSGPA
jgi:hypothetical protein